MNTMLATNDTMTLTRMAVIGRRTNSALMAGAKAMMVENVKNQMRNGVVPIGCSEKRRIFGTNFHSHQGDSVIRRQVSRITIDD